MAPIDDACTTAAVQRYLGELADVKANPSKNLIVQALLTRAVGRLEMLCGSLLYRSYPRLTRPPLNLQVEELLGGVVERLIKSLEKIHPKNVRQFFALANQHIRWELNDLVRRLGRGAAAVRLCDAFAVAPESSGSELGEIALKMLAAIDDLPESEREVFSLVRIQGMSQPEVAGTDRSILKNCAKTFKSELAASGDDVV